MQAVTVWRPLLNALPTFKYQVHSKTLCLCSMNHDIYEDEGVVITVTNGHSLTKPSHLTNDKCSECGEKLMFKVSRFKTSEFIWLYFDEVDFDKDRLKLFEIKQIDGETALYRVRLMAVLVEGHYFNVAAAGSTGRTIEFESVSQRIRPLQYYGLTSLDSLNSRSVTLGLFEKVDEEVLKDKVVSAYLREQSVKFSVTIPSDVKGLILNWHPGFVELDEYGLCDVLWAREEGEGSFCESANNLTQWRDKYWETGMGDADS